MPGGLARDDRQCVGDGRLRGEPHINASMEQSTPGRLDQANKDTGGNTEAAGNEPCSADLVPVG